MRERSVPAPEQSHHIRRRVLIAEDEPAMAHAIKRVLDRAGYETAIAGDGLMAVSMLLRFKPSVMTLDLRMPDLDGMEVLQFMQPVRATLPKKRCKVLVVSADTDDRLKQALALGADGVVPKPFSNEALVAEVARLLAEP